MRRSAWAALILVTSVLLAGCGGSSKTVQPVAAEHAMRPIPLVGTTWLLVSATRATGTVAARPNVDATLLVQPDGHYLLSSCNNVFGSMVTHEGSADFDGGSDTWRHCPGVAEEIDQLVGATLPGHVDWIIDGTRLTLHNPTNGIALAFRVRDGAPPLDVVPVVTLLDGAVRCRLMAGHTGVGDRLYALARTRAYGPWRLLPSGPAAPGEGPLLAPQLTDGKRACVAGLAPPSTATVWFTAPGQATRDVPVHHQAGYATPIYAGVVPSATPGGRLAAYDTGGHELATWATTP